MRGGYLAILPDFAHHQKWEQRPEADWANNKNGSFEEKIHLFFLLCSFSCCKPNTTQWPQQVSPWLLTVCLCCAKSSFQRRYSAVSQALFGPAAASPRKGGSPYHCGDSSRSAWPMYSNPWHHVVCACLNVCNYQSSIRSAVNHPCPPVQVLQPIHTHTHALTKTDTHAENIPPSVVSTGDGIPKRCMRVLVTHPAGRHPKNVK